MINFVLNNQVVFIVIFSFIFIVMILRIYKYKNIDTDNFSDEVNILGFGKAEGVYLIKVGNYYLVAGIKIKSKKAAVAKFIKLIENNGYIPPKSYFKMIRVKNINNKGFTLFELLIVIIVMAIMTAGGFTIYTALISSSEMSGVVNGIQSVQKIVGYYGQENNSFNGLNGQILHADNLLPNGWTYGGEDSNSGSNSRLYPESTGFVTYYWVGAVNDTTLGFTAGNYIIGVDSISMTNAQAQVLCNDFANQVQQYVYNGAVYNLPCDIPINSSLSGVLYFSF
jgi:prepilin-type N-terminal cleavage/methylation domain-containing protein